MYEFIQTIVGRYALPAGGFISLFPVMLANWSIRSSLIGRRSLLALQLAAVAASAVATPFPARWVWIPFVFAGTVLLLLRRANRTKDFMSDAELFASIALLFMASVLAVTYFWLGLLTNAHDQRQAGADMIVSALAFVVAWRRWTIISPQ
jgi:hypothetical protein